MNSETSDTTLSSRIASLVHAHFNALPTRSKPSIFPDGSREWIPMTGIVAVKGENTPLESLTCLTVTSGAKCLSASHIPRCNGLVLHDCHAEILAIRAFNYWLLTECKGLLFQEQQSPHDALNPDGAEPSGSSFIRRRSTEHGEDGHKPHPEWPPFEIQPDINIYMYCTCAPCGDGSMELCMAAQEDATPWEVPQQTQNCHDTEDTPNGEMFLDGRAHFSLLGIVRRKPSRTDAESTRSKSCSDKLALRQVSSLLSFETSRLVAPTKNVYIAGLVLPEEEISRVACERSFGANGRMKGLAGRSWPEKIDHDKETGYQFRPFQILSVPSEEVAALWCFAKPKPVTSPALTPSKEDTPQTQSAKKSKPGNASAVWTLAPTYCDPSEIMTETGSKALPTLRRSKTGLYETVINGVKQGNRASAPGARGASALSRAKLWALYHNMTSDSTLTSAQVGDVSAVAPETRGAQKPQESTYMKFKEPHGKEDPSSIRMQAIRDAQQVLKGWMPNSGDEGWGLDVLVDSKKRKR
ncbi:hypothetical protein N7452_000084 [Penicillium brevicompactum]|uniref:A to I editase domain-containing protein n=1 Tax=Penicillium brevicompactum TaxID=5074 RepID=A0A9W9QZW1_PENBR|nr:hypothetical protein N7452_000084 [Penicillium brevicompactum]